MKKNLLLLIMIGVLLNLAAQPKSGTTFSGTNNKDLSVCESSGQFMSEKEVDDLVSQLLRKIGTQNRYIIQSCTQVSNCQAVVFNGKPYILYNPEFLGRVKNLKFTEAVLPSIENKDWETLTILAHELGHHLNNHQTNPKPESTIKDRELEADFTAGFIIYLTGGTLAQAQLAYQNLPVADGMTHPGKQKRLESVARGWNDAQSKYPRSTGGNVVKPVVNDDPNTVHDWDGNLYKTVKIGTQVWTAQNLNTSHFKNGEEIKQVKNKDEWEEAAQNEESAWCYYQFNPAFEEKYGKLYNWYAVDDSRGLAPEGWHVPTMYEFDDLSTALGGNKVAGTKLKTNIGWNTTDSVSTNASGFTALPGGGTSTENGFNFFGVGKIASMWSSSEFDAYKAASRGLSYLNGVFYKVKESKEQCFSVRCVKDINE